MIPLPRMIREFGERPRRIAAIAVASQFGSRRNAMIASTALARRRKELIEVEEFFADLGVTTKPPKTDRTDQEAAAATAHR
jgi:hypothetical protein